MAIYPCMMTSSLLNPINPLILERTYHKKCITTQSPPYVKQISKRGLMISNNRSDQVDHSHICGRSASHVCHVKKDDLISNISSLIGNTSEWNQIMIPLEDTQTKVTECGLEEIKDGIKTIKAMFQRMSFGEISISAYDTAWVAMVPSMDGHNVPHFPKTLDWIICNQLPDGSWGDKDTFLAYDRVLSTLACLVALKSWNMGNHNIEKGLDFIRRNISRIEVESDEYMPIGFEVVFPTLLHDARELGLNLPDDTPMVLKIKEEREKKLKRIPMEVLHNQPTTLLHSMEGLHHTVEWNELLKLQSKNGSFLNSPASTACALKYTRDQKCLDYLNFVLGKFGNGVPNVYPVDLFERLWMVDRLERLGISRYFTQEIKECLDYVYKYWTNKGIGWASDAMVCDVDDTSMAFRLLRLHGYNVSPDVFQHFQANGKFFCFEGQTSNSLTGIFNTYRASQIMLPGETILEEMGLFTKSFLQEKQRKDTIHDKWVITKCLKGEVEYALKFPWKRSLPRVETRTYIDHYGVDDIWIGKTLYRMFNINNKAFLSLAKADYNMCQASHQREIQQIVKWNKESQFERLTFARQRPIQCYFLIAATLFEPEYSIARMTWTMSSVLTTLIDDFFDTKGSLDELCMFADAVRRWDPTLISSYNAEMKILFDGLYNTVNMINERAIAIQGRQVISHLRNFWMKWIASILIEAKWKYSQNFPSFDEYMENAKTSIALEPTVQSSLFFMGEALTDDQLAHPDYYRIMDLLSTIARLNNDIVERENIQSKSTSLNLLLRQNKEMTKLDAIEQLRSMVDNAMKDLVKEYLSDTKIPRRYKQVYLSMARVINFLYNKEDALSSIDGIAQHVEDTLFNPIY